MTNAASAERYARIERQSIYVERDTTDEINQFTALPRAPSREKAPFLSQYA